MLRADTEYTVWFDGRANGRNRGYLCTVADEPRLAPVRGLDLVEDWSQARSTASILDRSAEYLTSQPMTARELQARLGVSESATQTALGVLLQTGKLKRERKIEGAHRMRAFVYWIER